MASWVLTRGRLSSRSSMSKMAVATSRAGPRVLDFPRDLSLPLLTESGTPQTDRLGGEVSRDEEGDCNGRRVIAMVAVVVAVAFLGIGLAEAQAQQCSAMIKQVKDGAAKMTDAKKKAEVDKLLAEAQKLNDSGKDADCVKKSDEAAKTAGIKLEKKM
jgi:hypothetical protein